METRFGQDIIEKLLNFAIVFYTQVIQRIYFHNFKLQRVFINKQKQY